jgi:signal transduction histidine kinase
MEGDVATFEAQILASGFGREYATALARYLAAGGEAPLQDAYELGRQGLISGGGVLKMLNLHHLALARSFTKNEKEALSAADTVARAGEFCAESLSTFEMTLRAIGEANTALRNLNDTLEEEVQRIALALHDDAGQLMVAVHLALDDAVRDMPHDVQARMSGVKALLGLVEERIRDLSHELRPAMLDHLGLVPAVEFLAANVGQRTGLNITVSSTLDEKLPPKFSLGLYRIIQEALTNVRRHAHASRVRIQIGRRGSLIRCLISDNGIGFDPVMIEKKARPGLGLLGIRERLNALGGKLRIQSAEGRGTRLEITAPLPQVEHANSNSPRRRPSRGA